MGPAGFALSLVRGWLTQGYTGDALKEETRLGYL